MRTFTQNKFSLDKSSSYDTDSAIDAVLFLENLQNLNDENDNESVQKQGKQDDESCCKTNEYPALSDISEDELLLVTQEMEQKNLKSSSCLRKQDIPEDRFKEPVTEEEAKKLPVKKVIYKL